MSPKPARLFEEAHAIPETVRIELATVPKGEIGYWLLLDDVAVELLAQGVCSGEVARWAWEALAWKREHARNEARRSA